MASKTEKKVQISARIAPDVQKAMKASQLANLRTWEGEVEVALRYYLERNHD